MRKQWLRDLTDFTLITNIATLLTTFVLTIVSYMLYKSPYLLFLYGISLVTCVGVLDTIAIGLNLKFYEPTPMRATLPIELEHRRKLNIAEAYIRDQHPLYRHYNIRAVQDSLRGVVGRDAPYVFIEDSEVVAIVQKIRDEYDMGPIASYNMPGYVCSEEEGEAIVEEVRKMCE